MRQWVMVAMGAAAVGCSEPSAAPRLADVQRTTLEARTLDLQARVLAAGRITPEQRRELSELTTEIRAWQERTGRSDIAVSTPDPETGHSTYAAVPTGTTAASCDPCAPVTASGGKICFLSYDGACIPGDLINMKVCVYVCITLDPGVAPIKRR